ncbi:gamma-glutamylcyclotransferase [Jiella pelagia]|uniref:glutathione-specific gamma-glutamylcyclotransferase n=1 Tax=Jiella pelagia TaxID=2986949 RepID=A0ABY7BX81_9HYPH|nr:gamma-glutamylcyclotransferase [Jiella pelagia]WAP68052.1 gamma-glutamylcyclotransferase [Jiella pelagia]
MNDFWVFGYGSLIWRPGFDYVESAKARLAGYHRALCVHSHVHRGTPERPGLVFGLDRGGSCVGIAFRVEGSKRDETIAYLRARELVTNVYREAALPVRATDGRRIDAITYVVDRGHPQYAGKIDAASAAAIVARSHGQSGPNVDYVRSAFERIAAMGLRDRWLQEVVSRL